MNINFFKGGRDRGKRQAFREEMSVGLV